MQPLAQPPKSTDRSFDDWMFRLWKRISSTAGIAWSLIDKTGSNITDIATRNHADLQNINTASYTHLSATNHTDLTDAGDSALHYHAADRARANHSGTQLAATVSDFDSAVTASTHAGLTNNPHAVTAAQAGAKVSGAVEGIATGGSGQTTAQLAINALSAVSSATNEHVLTKDTATGNAIFKAAASVAASVIAEVAATISSSVSITSGNNGISVSPVTIATGVTVTIPTGSIWLIGA